MALKESSPAIEPPAPLGQQVVEATLIFALFFLFAGGQPPGVNESHYLCKAKHYWNPTWCENDYFLKSSDAHAMFYWTCGWLTKFTSLSATAWIGRAAVWLLQAWAWQRLSWAVVPRPLYALLSAGVFLALIRNFHMAGEWVVGDVEAKGFAYVFVVLGLEALVRQRWHWVFPLLGAGAAFHVIVGGWAVIAAAVAWLALRRWQSAQKETPSFTSLVPSLALGFLLSLPGLLPCVLLDRGTPPEIVAQGNVAYVYARLSHHLVINRIPWQFIARHLMLIAVTAGVAYRWRNDTTVQRLMGFTGGAILLAAIGAGIDQSLLYASDELRAKLLRFYWYRLSDSIVPVALALLLCRFAAGLVGRSKAMAPNRALVAGLIALATWNIVDVKLIRWSLGVPEAELRLGISDAASISLRQRHYDWLQCCYWIRNRTPQEATFLTPRTQQTFLWYAERAEVVNWKNCPQDAQGVVEWLKRYEDVYPHPSGEQIMFGPAIDPALPQQERLQKLAAKYGATFIVVDRLSESAPLNLAPVYPLGDEFNISFAVYRVPQPGPSR